jgi:hypothetical protein
MLLNKRLKPIDKQIIIDYYNSKFEEYSKHTSDELKSIWEESQKDKSKRIGGTNRRAFLDVLSKKLQEESIKNMIVENKENV